MRIIFIVVFSVLLCSASFAQVQWDLVEGRARMQTLIDVPERDATYLYKQINRWLVATFRNPEDVLKARIESEYLRGEAYHANFMKLGALSSIDFQYTFSVDIKDGKVRLTLINGLILYDDSDANGVTPVEQYFDRANQKKKDAHAEKVISAMNTLSSALLTSLKGFLTMDLARTEDW